MIFVWFSNSWDFIHKLRALPEHRTSPEASSRAISNALNVLQQVLLLLALAVFTFLPLQSFQVHSPKNLCLTSEEKIWITVIHAHVSNFQTRSGGPFIPTSDPVAPNKREWLLLTV